MRDREEIPEAPYPFADAAYPADADGEDDAGSGDGPAHPDLHKMTRADLDAYAEGCGVEDPGSYPNKAALIDAIAGGDGAAAAGAATAEAESARFRVLKGITLGDGRTLMPGDELDMGEHGADFPDRRPKQLVDQKYLRPMNDAARAAAKAAPTED